MKRDLSKSSYDHSEMCVQEDATQTVGGWMGWGGLGVREGELNGFLPLGQGFPFFRSVIQWSYSSLSFSRHEPYNRY